MNWIQVKANISPAIAEALEEGLLAAGASAVTLEDAQDQPVLEPERGTTPLWEETIVTGLFSADEDQKAIRAITESVFTNLSDQTFPELRFEILENEDWTRKWIDNFKPIQFGRRLWICPSWHDIPEPNAVNLMLDPGLAFGTGTHPTTALCLKWLDAYALNDDGLNNKTVVDFGCGSGILGLAALLLGAKSVVGIDNDPQALLATQDNAKRNEVEAQQFPVYLPEDSPKDQVDLVLANILAQPLHDLRSNIAALVKPKGKLILSGILEHQAAALVHDYEEWFEMDKPQLEDGWVCLTGTKKD
ncbi:MULTISPECIES: 50S ribosomal protein L11 methyltransferase [unclassified Oleiphilus]|nr:MULTISPECIES: 50S ribosomal protein L11 methyltransferase [unclassified Oleiphilus]KZY43124.1 ribosomal protein L11 methyltransferase [Oleiphilus sp. HI0050]KZY73275.1 ribosomal protein L11 methyltransferase [Oleiphilus sp. HI0068]KZZ11532.1 ribosomal protein L11 methyltransferase [Oleiphilus sp. HI0078]KZZ30639.1 ribosomal protein L11 methyltransferase [Oleiphilus sp. HI0085]KZY28455.1 ribosomal protein L11 methyltransferase [Oleiphilus sp. HI0043]